ncbi:MAG: hypothetical protein AB8C02_09715 [Halioglobus sp.]
MKLARNIAILLAILTLFGCATFRPPWTRLAAVDHPTDFERSYEPLVSYSVSVGDRMLGASKARMIEYYEPLQEYAIPWRGARLASSKWFPQYRWNGTEGDFVLKSPNYFNGAIGIISSEEGAVPPNPVMRIDGKGSLDRYPIGNADENSPVFRKQVILIPIDDGFQFELLYTGRSKDSISILYREYIGDLSRSSFYQELTYDLAESNVIQFRSIRIEVAEATNSEIRYKVLEDGNLEWAL